MTGATTASTDLAADCRALARRAREAARQLATAPTAAKDAWLRSAALAIRKNRDEILEANALDLEAATGARLAPALVDRLRLTPSRLESAAAGLRQVAELPDPVGQVRESRVRPNGL